MTELSVDKITVEFEKLFSFLKVKTSFGLTLVVTVEAGVVVRGTPCCGAHWTVHERFATNRSFNNLLCVECGQEPDQTLAHMTSLSDGDCSPWLHPFFDPFESVLVGQLLLARCREAVLIWNQQNDYSKLGELLASSGGLLSTPLVQDSL